MKKIMKLLGCLLLCQLALSCSSHLPKSPDYGKYDASFDKVFEDITQINPVDELHSLVVLQGGKLIYDRHDAAHSLTSRHVLWSASKSFTSLAAGFAIQDGLLSLDDKVIGFFGPEDLPEEISPNLQKMTVRDLLIMSSGFSKDLIGEARSLEKAAKSTLSTDFSFEPGSRYRYNSMNTYLVAVIVSKVTGQALDEYLNIKLFKPLGIKDWYWEKTREGYCCGGWGLYLSPESMAKAGQFLLQEGKWKGKQLLNASYIREATSAHILQYQLDELTPEEVENLPNNDWRQGYGYQFWKITHGAYKMSGARCQWVIVIPDKDAVIVLTSYCSNGQKLTDSIWKNVYPLL